ncbi:uncharacterized protein LOC134235506 [Saccostrea cucullata]|uniref:uncharacterized protein LOC134235506 n=1 Tax=Saccostrea cuccullata TaxID=36930 RepID=UPI002ECFE685
MITMDPPKKTKFQDQIQSATAQKIYILEDIEIRKYKDGGIYGKASILCAKTYFGCVHDLIVTNEAIFPKIRADSCYLVVDYLLLQNGLLKMTEATKLMDTARPTINQSVVTQWKNPQLVKVAELTALKKGDRVSIKGTVTKVSSLLETEVSKRKIISIEEDGNVGGS